MDREQFLLERRSGIGGSDIAAIAGENPYKKPIDVYLEKIGVAPDREITDQMEVGTWMEPKIIEMYARKTGNRVVYFASNGHSPDSELVETVPQRLFRFPGQDYLMCHPDGLIANSDETFIGAIECKTAGIRQSAFFGQEDTDEIPTQYLMQLQWTMGICGAELKGVESHRTLNIGHLPLILDNRFKFYKTDFSQDMFDSMRKIADDFWHNHVIPLIPPEPDDSEEYSTYLKSAFKDAGTEIVATPEIEELMVQFAITKKSFNEIDTLKRFQQNRLEAFIGNNALLKGNQLTMTWKKDKPGFATDWEAICSHLKVPDDVIATFTHQKKEVRRLLGPKAVK